MSWNGTRRECWKFSTCTCVLIASEGDWLAGKHPAHREAHRPLSTSTGFPIFGKLLESNSAGYAGTILGYPMQGIAVVADGRPLDDDLPQPMVTRPGPAT
jgi:hypothetical protein